MKTVKDPKFNTTKPQKYADPWRNAKRVLRFQGKCVACGRRTYAFDDGENDPRGILGDRAASPLVAAENGAEGEDVPACFPCMNEEPSYRYALDVAKARWAKRKV